MAPTEPDGLIIPKGLRERLAVLFPGAAVVGVEPLRPDTGTGEAGKGLGYGRPMRVRLRHDDGQVRSLVFHLEGANDFGHDRRADRAGNVLLAWDTFSRVPHHARSLDVGGVTADGHLVPLQDVGELYLLTEWAEGEVYAEDLRRIARTGVVEPLDLARVDQLAKVLLEVHAGPGTHPGAYVRALRDLVGSGEGIAGIVDGYGPGAPGAPPERLAAIERSCLAWRQRLKHRTSRLRRTHGDFHPFNLVFAKGESTPTLLDTSRGSQGEPADDVACLAINFLFFGLEHPERWSEGLGVLWRRFWRGYLAGGDAEVLDVIAPFFAWRALVLCNPAWYPHLRETDRDRMLSFAERVLAAPRFDPSLVTPSPLEGERVGVRGVVVWFTGLPSSGKSTLAAKVATALEGRTSVVTLDGDAVRAALHPAPGYGEAERGDFYETLAQLAALTAKQGHVVLVPATAHLRAYRARARALAPAFLEVFVDTPRDTCRARDSKGLYASAPDRLPGVGVAFEAPTAPELVITPDAPGAVERLVGLITSSAPRGGR